ncbi:MULTISPECIES: ScpA family protein [unclassified Curtobacterium]|uniref:segregation and condensation protein A n=1 Tax=unclassified Curtobacterium TaxID=257496 RepID=UPI000DA9E0D0|nr:segregation/condensation protein A [Curtobacterium sp. MCBD17_028]PZE71594.1 segregation/condensation protein A [Curtobacterium sp. MCBD17_019]PZF61261.1 segregation/condensation protein A [Curtobacterium sp. MCBD17_034]PZM33094.1 segregation/condensation protein A [Curtobacterium sp. MCBD17_031]
MAPSPDPTRTAPEALTASATETDGRPGFRVTLANFDGPFDLLLSLITKRELDITEVALSAVTTEFIAYVRAAESAEELDEASEFLVVAATLLDLKIAGLLPQGELVDAEDVALLEARDLLFARLLQYRAFKQAAHWFGAQWDTEVRRHVRSVRLEERFRARTPELVWTLSVQDFAALAAVALAPREIPTVGLDHLHAPLVSIREQAAIVVSMLRNGGEVTFRQLIAGVTETGIVVARFLAILELYRNASIAFEQLEPLGELTIRWTADHWSDESLANLGADYDG